MLLHCFVVAVAVVLAAIVVPMPTMPTMLLRCFVVAVAVVLVAIVVPIPTMPTMLLRCFVVAVALVLAAIVVPMPMMLPHLQCHQCALLRKPDTPGCPPYY